MLFTWMEGCSGWQLWSGGIARPRWGSLRGGWSVVAARPPSFPLALRLPRRTQQLRFVPLALTSRTETLQKKVHPVLQSSWFNLLSRFLLHLMSFELSNTSVGPHRWYPWSFCSQTIIVPWIDLTETSAFGRVCWKP